MVKADMFLVVKVVAAGRGENVQERERRPWEDIEVEKAEKEER